MKCLYPRFVISMTTIPKRLMYINRVLDSILKQTILPDKIYINIPRCSRSGETYTIPSGFLSEYDGNDIIYVNRCEEYGPITKLLPTLDIETDPETIIITVDDDIHIHPNTLRVVLKKARIYKDKVFSFSGICISHFPFYWSLVNCNDKDISVDVVEGVHCIVYRRKLLNKEDILRFQEKTRSVLGDIVYTNDDHVISGYLSSKHIEKISINKRPIDYFYDLPQKKLGGISSRNIRFWIENVKLARHFTDLGYYGKGYSLTSSLLFPIIVLSVLIVKNKIVAFIFFVLYFIVRKNYVNLKNIV
jgi:hypothetical protein